MWCFKLNKVVRLLSGTGFYGLHAQFADEQEKPTPCRAAQPQKYALKYLI